MYDVIVIGGGPSGSNAARKAAELGLDVILYDKKKFPRVKPCGGALSLRTYNIVGENAKSKVNSRIDGAVVFSPKKLRVEHWEHYGYMVVRKEFDHAMLNDAKAAGAKIVEECPIISYKQFKDHVEVETCNGVESAKYLIVARGVRPLPHEDVSQRRWTKQMLAQTFESETKVSKDISDSIVDGKHPLMIYFGVVETGYGWLFPKDGYLNIGVGLSVSPNIRAIDVYNDFVKYLYESGTIPEDVKLSKPLSHPIPFNKPLEPTVIDRVLYVGDAAGFVSPVTGEGMFYAVTSGLVAAEAIKKSIETGEMPGTYYVPAWREAFGDDLIKYGLYIRDFVYKSISQQERLIRLAHSDPKLMKIVSDMIMGKITYEEAKRKVLRRIPISFFKSIL